MILLNILQSSTTNFIVHTQNYNYFCVTPKQYVRIYSETVRVIENFKYNILYYNML